MKTLLKLVVLFISTTFFAQNTIEKTIGEFTELKVYDLIDVELVKSEVDKVVITGLNVDDVLIHNKNGKLKIKMALKEIFDGKKTNIKLYYTKVDIIDANEGASVHSKDEIKQFEIDLRAQEGGKIDIPINTTYTNIKAVTGGKIKTSGTTKNQKISILTGGIYTGKDLVTETTEVDIKVGSSAYINASKLVEVKTMAGGMVYIYGKPEKVVQIKSLGGDIKFIED